ncbi:uncharacterized protein LOC144860600 [Branchiostoma floridae x Branchiostoma japonicum]
MWTAKLPPYCDLAQAARYRPLSPEDHKLVTNLLEAPPSRISHRDLLTLEDEKWISDNVIELYLPIIKAAEQTCKIEYFNCSAYDQLRLRKQFGKYKNRQKTPKDIQGSDIVFMPVYQASHWGLLVYYVKKKWVVLMDSLQSSHCINQVTALARAKRFLTFYLPKNELNWKDWTFYMPPADEIPQQTNGNDCGVFVCQYALHLARKIPLNFSQVAIPNIRKWMVLEICTASLREDRIKMLQLDSSSPTRRKRERDGLKKRRHRSPSPLPVNRSLQFSDWFKSENTFSSDSGMDADVSNNTLTSEDIETSPMAQPSTSTPKEMNVKSTKGGRKKGGKRKHLSCGREGITTAWTTTCPCPRDCCEKIGLDIIRHCRETFWALKRDQQKSFIYNTLQHADRRQEVNRSYEFSIQGHVVCHLGWRIVNGVGRSRFYEVKSDYERGRLPDYEDGRQGMEYPTRKWLTAKEWLQQYAKKFGDTMPNSPDVHLPQCVSRNDIHQLYQEDLWYEGTLKRSRFNVMWKKELRHVKIPPQNRFTKCDECDDLKDLLNRAKTKGDIQKVKERRSAHFTLQSTARQKYYSHIKKAKQQPDNYLSLIIDSMDQNKTFLPHFATLTKSKSNLKPLKFHLTGVLAHGQKKSFIYAWTPKFHMDTNITVNVLISVLQDLSKGYGGHLPGTLYLQLDNSAKECKNKYIIAFCAWLVKRQIFRKVKLGYLMPGHTHEDVDQMFSRISTYLERHDATSLPELFQAVKASYNPSPDCRFMNSMWDFKTPIDQQIANISGHSRPHTFTAQMVGGEVKLSAQLWPTKGEIKVDIPTNVFIPQFPQLSTVREWKFDPDDNAVKEHDTMVKVLKNDLVKWSETVRVEEGFIPWWENFLMQEKREPGKPEWKISTLKKYRPPVDKESVLTDEAEAILDKHKRKRNAPLNIIVKGKRKLGKTANSQQSVKKLKK